MLCYLDFFFFFFPKILNMDQPSTGPTGFICSYCKKVYGRKDNLQRHVREKHSDDVQRHDCPRCDKTFSRKESLRNHLKNHADRQTCPTCGAPFNTKTALQAHLRSHKTNKKRKKSSRRVDDYNEEDDIPDEFLDVYKENWGAIRTHHYKGKHQSMYNFRWKDGGKEAPDWNESLDDVFKRQTKRFKINVSHSLVLHHRENDTYRFYHSSQNNARVFDKPRLINDPEDFQQFVEELNQTDVLEYARQQRPDSKWTVHSVVATTFFINPLADFPIGCGGDETTLPDSIVHRSGINSLVRDYTHSFLYADNLCFFRCLALHTGATLRNLQIPTRELFHRWTTAHPTVDAASFPGVTLKDLSTAEDLYRINIDVFELQEKEDVLTPLRRSKRKYSDNTLRVLMYENHFCYIHDIHSACRAFCCSKCGKLWKKEFRLRRHESTCRGPAVKETYAGGVYQPPKTPLEILHDNGVLIDTTYCFPYRATYDFESYQERIEEKNDAANTVYTSRHVPLSVSVASNVPSYEEPRCFVTTGDSYDLLDRMISFLEEISDHSYRLLREEFRDAYDDLEARELRENEAGEEPVTSMTSTELIRILDSYLHELPVIGFNSAKYDINLVKPYFFQRLLSDQNDEPGIKFLIKNNNEYKCVATWRLKFLDITYYLAPGFSYRAYLAAYDIPESKGFFPYEFVTDLAKLDTPTLPPIEAFYSQLKQTAIEEKDYRYCQKVWRDHKMTTLRDYLVNYNNRDVKPFLMALDKQAEFYREELCLDLFKDGVGVPGLTLRYLFKTLPANTFFSLIPEKQRDLHLLLREQMVGGPAIIFCRHQEKNVTRLREPDVGKLAARLEGYDANALYLWALMQDMPTEHPVRRLKETNYSYQKQDFFGQMAREWLEWIAHTKDVRIRHKYNDKEQSLGKRKIRVDGWDAENRTAYQFHGCLFHGHHCQSIDINPLNGQPLFDLRQKTDEISAYLRTTVGVKVVEIWECQWKTDKRDNPDLSAFLKKRFPPYVSPYESGAITVDKIVRAVEQGKLFGLVQCDIEVPERLRSHFSEMTPIFKNIEVSRDDIGDFMKTYAERHGLLSRPLRTLVGSYFGRRIVLATPLLRWYLSHGLIVTDVQQVVEYQPKKVFQGFGQTVTTARRTGDADPSKKILAETFKLLGNSAYGKTITNLTKHRDITFLTDESEVSKRVNNPLFQKLTSLNDDLVEVEMSKSRLRWNLPNQIGFFVYQNAKLRMLQFHYDCVDKFVSRKNYQLCEMDTDSLYMALSDVSLEKVVRPSLRRQFFEEWNDWFPARTCDRHRQDFIIAMSRDETWVQPPCCAKRQQLDKRTPGLFKLEFGGDGIVALCSKTYYCFGDDQKDKISCKGLSKRLNRLMKESYLEVLRTMQAGGGVNRGFRTDGKTIYTYRQNRKSLSFFYIKREIQSDGVSTRPLSV